MIKRRSLFFQFIVFFLTFGLYQFYWYYSTLEEMVRYQDDRAETLLWTIGLIIPIVNFFSWWKYASTVDRLTGSKYPAIVLWLLGVFFIPGLWILVQLELNSMSGDPPVARAS